MNIPYCIPRVEPGHAHKEFVEKANPDMVMVNLITARRLVKREETAESFFPSTDVMVTSTIPDNKLELISWEKEKEIITSFNPSYHLPTDYPVYADQSEETRKENIEKCLNGSVWMKKKLSDTDITIIPLLKGIKPRERRVYYQVMKEIDQELVGYYAAQHFTNGGNNITAVEEQLESINTHSDLDILVIGLLSPNYLERLPDNVIAASGKYQWRSRITPTKETSLEVRETFNDLEQSVNQAIK